MSTNAYVVQGMNCENCVASLTKKARDVPGVTDAVIDLSTGKMEVTGHGAINDAAIRQVVEQAGFQIA
ncbi:heavy-metal-associated domain-containing protein [Streptosporangium subroseum]|uniref:heavy-metal-associated domain-containing protein n=1 Tax=Streptosporangium subroseum TaxID=106412 RepID=UPI00308A022B|nr:heavy-metal-associated domain-containing protein [Streptosporangium subroseum]